MADAAELWSELREFATCTPTALAFRALGGLLDVWPGEDRPQAIETAANIVQSWPDATRLAPWSWCKAALRGDLPAAWSLARAIDLNSGHLSKRDIGLARLARHAPLDHLTELAVARYGDDHDLSFLYHRPDAFPALRRLQATDRFQDGQVRALAKSPLWQTLEHFEVESLGDSLFHTDDASRIVPQLPAPERIRRLRLRARDLMALWDRHALPSLESAAVFIRSIDEARALAARPEIARLASLAIAFRTSFNGGSPGEPFLGNILESDEAAADCFFADARLERLERLEIRGYRMGYWGREGLGALGLESGIAAGVFRRLKHLRLELLPLGDEGMALLAPALGTQLESLELRDVYCKSAGAAVLAESPCLVSLRILDLSGNRIDSAGFARLAAAAMPHLTSLDVSGPAVQPYYFNIGQQPLLDAGAAAWARSPNAARLERLGMRNGFLGDGALEAVFQSPRLGALRELDLSNNVYSAQGLLATRDSRRWQSLESVGLSHCRLDDAGISALCQVPSAPKLRSLRLGYNNFGPAGAKALAQWSALAGVWELDLHDNVVGDAGLVALAESPYLGRLLELDLEQDCWNSRQCGYNDETARAIADSRSLRRLDALFTGCVDEYHGTAYAPGFSKDAIETLRHAAGRRAAFRASTSDFSGISEYLTLRPFDEHAAIGGSDFRRTLPELDQREGSVGARNMRQLHAPPTAEKTIDLTEPPQISPLEEPADEPLGIEGLEFRDPAPVEDVRFHFELQLEAERRPLPGQASKFLAETLESILNAQGRGSFDMFGSASRQADDGQQVNTSSSYYLSVQGDPQPALDLLREALWWMRASDESTLSKSSNASDDEDYDEDYDDEDWSGEEEEGEGEEEDQPDDQDESDDQDFDDDFDDQDFDDSREASPDETPLALDAQPAHRPARLLQLAKLSVARWSYDGMEGHRIDRQAVPKEVRDALRGMLTQEGDADSAPGWATIRTADGGRLLAFVKYLDDPKLNTLNLLADVLTPQVSDLVYRLMGTGDVMLLPMTFAATKRAAATLDCPWPRTTIVKSAEPLHALLDAGPFVWWSDASD